MREDSTVAFYLVQHVSGNTGRWTTSALGEFLFRGLTYDQKRGKLGDEYRKLIDPINECWQRHGIHGFLLEREAIAAHIAVTARHPDRSFRVVRRIQTRATEVVYQ